MYFVLFTLQIFAAPPNVGGLDQNVNFSDDIDILILKTLLPKQGQFDFRDNLGGSVMEEFSLENYNDQQFVHGEGEENEAMYYEKIIPLPENYQQINDLDARMNSIGIFDFILMVDAIDFLYDVCSLNTIKSLAMVRAVLNIHSIKLFP